MDKLRRRMIGGKRERKDKRKRKRSVREKFLCGSENLVDKLIHRFINKAKRT